MSATRAFKTKNLQISQKEVSLMMQSILCFCCKSFNTHDILFGTKFMIKDNAWILRGSCKMRGLSCCNLVEVHNLKTQILLLENESLSISLFRYFPSLKIIL